MANRAAVVSEIIKRDDIRAKAGEQLDKEIAFEVARAVVEEVFKKQSGESEGCNIAVGRDARLSSPALSEALIRGLSEAATCVYEIGLCTTEMVYFAAGRDPQPGDPLPKMDGGIMVTASHLPGDRNGFKIVKRNAEPIARHDLMNIGSRVWRTLMERGSRTWHLPPWCPRNPLDLTADYARTVIEISGILSTPQAIQWAATGRGEKLRVVVEGGNGTAPAVFREVARNLPFVEVIYSHDDPDGEFPVCLPDPLDTAYMGLVQRRVRAERADLGLAFDADGDRVGAVDDCGGRLTPSEVMALLAEGLFRDNGGPGIEVLHNLCVSRLVPDIVRQHEAKPLMTPVGHGQIKNQMRKHPACVVAGEHSGHFFFRPYFGADSGMIAALTVLREVLLMKAGQESLHDHVARWRKRYCSCDETNFDLRLPQRDVPTWEQDRRREACLQGARQLGEELGAAAVSSYQAPKEAIEPTTLKMELGTEHYDAWFCIRPSGNEPLLRLNAEVILSQEGLGAGTDGQQVLRSLVDKLAQRIGPQYLKN